MRWRADVLRFAVCHGATLTPSGLLESLTPFWSLEAEAAGTANAVIVSTPITEAATGKYLALIGAVRELPVPDVVRPSDLAGRVSSDGDVNDSLRSQ
jgi:hypothetical protein